MNYELTKGRFAPSPTGRMHLGNVFSALLSWLSVKSKGGKWLLRIEDIDPQRSKQQYADQIMKDLEWLGLTWDEGPYYQSERSEIYEEYLEKLRQQDLLYLSYKTRAERLAVSAPQENGNGNGNENVNDTLTLRYADATIREQAHYDNEKVKGQGDKGQGTRDKDSLKLRLKRKFEKKVLYSTPMLSAYLSMVIVALGIDNIPEAISKPLTMIGNITVPGALMIIGSTMAQLSGRAMLGNVTVYATSLFRLVLIPLAFYWLFTWMGYDPYVVNINTVIIAMPVATYGTILCLINNRDTTLMTELTFTTTIISMVTIPLLASAFS